MWNPEEEVFIVEEISGGHVTHRRFWQKHGKMTGLAPPTFEKQIDFALPEADTNLSSRLQY
jgi:hypothetical protein